MRLVELEESGVRKNKPALWATCGADREAEGGAMAGLLLLVSECRKCRFGFFCEGFQCSLWAGEQVEQRGAHLIAKGGRANRRWRAGGALPKKRGARGG